VVNGAARLLQLRARAGLDARRSHGSLPIRRCSRPGADALSTERPRR
jgi:hypothetical protein